MLTLHYHPSPSPPASRPGYAGENIWYMLFVYPRLTKIEDAIQVPVQEKRAISFYFGISSISGFLLPWEEPGALTHGWTQCLCPPEKDLSVMTKYRISNELKTGLVSFSERYKLAQKSFASPGKKCFTSKMEDTKIILYIWPHALES